MGEFSSLDVASYLNENCTRRFRGSFCSGKGIKSVGGSSDNDVSLSLSQITDRDKFEDTVLV
jgi:hypothetical protein